MPTSSSALSEQSDDSEEEITLETIQPFMYELAIVMISEDRHTYR